MRTISLFLLVGLCACGSGDANSLFQDPAPSCTTGCTAGAMECVQDAVRTCSGSGGCGQWDAPVPCPQQTPYCSNGVCGASCQEECASTGSRRCVGDGYQVCQLGAGSTCLRWGATTVCSGGEACQGDGTCCAASCDGKACGAEDGCGGKCLTGSCPNDGTCKAGVCDNTPCTDGQKDCTGNTPRVCAGGKWLPQSACVGGTPVCDNGVCVECVSGAAECTQDTPRLCIDHHWQVQAPCAGDHQFCKAGACIPCDAGLANCNGLSADGCETSLQTIDACGACGSKCADNGSECQQPVCQNGKCAVQTLGTGTPCADDGNPCTSDVCNGGTCAHQPANEGQACGAAPNDCSLAPTCVGGQCKAKPRADGTACGSAWLEYCLGGECKKAQYTCNDNDPNGFTLYVQVPFYGNQTVMPCPTQGAGSGYCHCDGTKLQVSGSGYECTSLTATCSSCVSVGLKRYCW